jgi:hypothetical protein
VLDRPGRQPVAIECKWSAGDFDPGGIRAFRRRYPGRVNLVVAADVDRSYARTYGNLRVEFLGLPHVGDAVIRRTRR